MQLVFIHLQKNTPKPLLQVGGKAIIDYIVEEINTLDAVDEILCSK